MTFKIKALSEPQEFWVYFEKISNIPRCSGNEDGIKDFIKNEAESFKFKTKTDTVGNLVVKIPPTNQKNKALKLVFQSHMDMVCEKNQNINHDFSKDPLKISIIEMKNEKWITAEGTTLGADNGVGIAYSLAFMQKIYNKEIDIGSLSLDFLFTVDEESGLVGAFNIDSKLIDGDYLINLDSEEDDKFTIGCAGGVNTTGIVSYNQEMIQDKGRNIIPCIISIKGLIGGHSGVDINKGRGNAIKIISRILVGMNEYSIHIHSINGGSRTNVIPREVQAIIYVEEKDFLDIKKLSIEVFFKVKREIGIVDPEIILTLEKLDDFNERKIIPEMLKNKLLTLLVEFHNGPISWHPEYPNLVHTSTNLASIKTGDDCIEIKSSQRSLKEVSKQEINQKIQSLFKGSGINFKIETYGDYPGWEPDFNSDFLLKTKKTYKELFKQDVIVKAIHAGLECGILKKKFSKMGMISLGPTILGAHSPDERLKVSSIEKIWNLLIKLLKSIV